MKVRPHGGHKWVNSHPFGTDVGKMGESWTNQHTLPDRLAALNDFGLAVGDGDRCDMSGTNIIKW